MKFFINKENLQYAIQNVQRAISVKSPKPILTGILFKCENGMLELTATDMELSVRCSVPAEINEPGSLVVPARYISDFARKLPDLPIEFETIGGSSLATIRYGQSEFNINGYNSLDFPSFPTPEGQFSFEMDAVELVNNIKKVIYASSNDDARPVFTGVLLEIKGEEATMVATDTFRLAVKRFVTGTPSAELINVIIPGKALNEVVRTMGSGEKVAVTISQNHIMFETENLLITSRLISGRFPSYRQVIPENFNCIVKAPVKETLDAADRASLLAGERNSLILFQTRSEGIVISVKTETGWIREDIPAQVEGEDLDILFNVRYLSDVLKTCETGEIEMKITGVYTPALMCPPGTDDYVSIIVPARISKE